MRSTGTRVLGVLFISLACFVLGHAQERSASDPRVGLKAGLRDAGEAARNMERIASLPKPDGFFDPKAPAGTPVPPEPPPRAGGDAATPAGDTPARGATAAPGTPPTPRIRQWPTC